MDFMDKVTEISKKVGVAAEKTYKTVADKSGKIIEETKLKLKINEKESAISEIYLDLGKTVYDMYILGEQVGDVFTKECKKIDKLVKETQDMEAKTLYIKNLRKCSTCEEIISIDDKFCVKCGSKQKKVAIKEEKVKKEEKKEEEPLDRVCPSCGQIMPFEAAFCTKCGYKFN